MIYMWRFDGDDITKHLEIDKGENMELLLDHRYGRVYMIGKNTNGRESLSYLAQGKPVCDLLTFSGLVK